jgi:hypothetical protein
MEEHSLLDEAVGVGVGVAAVAVCHFSSRGEVAQVVSWFAVSVPGNCVLCRFL